MFHCGKALAYLRQVTAAIIALLNDARLRAGKPALGFLNPWIYSGGYKGFTDITAGQSDGCDGGNTQTGGAVNGVSPATTLSSLSTTNFRTVWDHSRRALERHCRVGSSDWIWYAQLRRSEGRRPSLDMLTIVYKNIAISLRTNDIAHDPDDRRLIG